MRSKLLALLGCLALAVTAGAQTWAEVGDAPPIGPAPQMTVGVGPLMAITGTADYDGSQHDADMYMVYVDGDFSATTVGGASWDTMLALYTPDGITQLFFNDDFGSLQSLISGSVSPGLYQLGITSYPDFSFTGASAGGPSPYRIDLTGMRYAIPEPAAFVLLAAGLLLRRR